MGSRVRVPYAPQFIGGVLKLVKRAVLKTVRSISSRHGGSNPSTSANYKITIMEAIFLNLILEENCKTIGNFNDELLVKSKWHRPMLTDNYYSFITTKIGD